MTDYLSAIEGVPADFSALPQSALSDKLPLQPGKVLVLPTRSMPLPADSLNDEYSPAESAIFDDYGLLVVNALNAISYDDATKAARARYIAFYDPELAHRWRTGTATTPDDMQKLQLLRRFERAEWQLLGKEDEHF